MFRAAARTRRLAPVVVAGVLVVSCSAPAGPGDRGDLDRMVAGTAVPDAVTAVPAAVETVPVPHETDAADDAAIWVHPSDPVSSTVIGTDKDGGIGVYDLAGRELQYVEQTSPNGVDIRQAVTLGDRVVDLVAVSDRSSELLVFYVVDAPTRTLRRLAAVDSGIDLYGVCLYRSARTGELSVFGTAYDGEVAQYVLTAPDGRLHAEPVRAFDVGDQIEGCAADDELGRLYVGEERRGVWRYGAEPADGDRRDLVDGTGRLVPDVEGVAIAAQPSDGGHLVVSSQGSDDFVVYGRGGPNRYIARFAVGGGPIDGTSHTDGLAVTAASLGPGFPGGLLVVQDDDNDGPDPDRQNFKLIRWDDVLATLPDG